MLGNQSVFHLNTYAHLDSIWFSQSFLINFKGNRMETTVTLQASMCMSESEIAR